MEEACHYKVRDKVLLDRKNLTISEGTNRVLSNRWIEPHKVLNDEWHGHVYELDILARTSIHTVILASLLKSYADR